MVIIDEKTSLGRVWILLLNGKIDANILNCIIDVLLSYSLCLYGEEMGNLKLWLIIWPKKKKEKKGLLPTMTKGRMKVIRRKKKDFTKYWVIGIQSHQCFSFANKKKALFPAPPPVLKSFPNNQMSPYTNGLIQFSLYSRPVPRNPIP